MRVGAGAAEHPLRSFPEGSGGAVHAIPPPALSPLNRPSTPPIPYLSLPSPSSPSSTKIITEIHGDHGDPRRSPWIFTEITARRARAWRARRLPRSSYAQARGQPASPGREQMPLLQTLGMPSVNVLARTVKGWPVCQPGVCTLRLQRPCPASSRLVAATGPTVAVD